MRIALIMRGVPGSGKSTLAKVLAGEHGVIHSTDSYFYKEGEYCFDPALLSENHQKNLEAFTESLRRGVEVVICDNTNVRRRHWEVYASAAREAGYYVATITLPHPDPRVAAERNTHQVSEATIRRMIEDWEP